MNTLSNLAQPAAHARPFPNEPRYATLQNFPLDTPLPERRALTEAEDDGQPEGRGAPEDANEDRDANDGPSAKPDYEADLKTTIQTLQGGWVQATGNGERRASFDRLFTRVTPWAAQLARRDLSHGPGRGPRHET